MDHAGPKPGISTAAALGAVGDGGGIVLQPQDLILDGGFIQANTAAVGARGGDIWISSQVLLASQGRVEIGGVERASFSAGAGRNVIQAAPGGEQGVITVLSPELDLAAALVPLATSFAAAEGLLTDPCQAWAAGAGSSSVEGGSGGLPPGINPPPSHLDGRWPKGLDLSSAGAGQSGHPLPSWPLRCWGKRPSLRITLPLSRLLVTLVNRRLPPLVPVVANP